MGRGTGGVLGRGGANRDLATKAVLLAPLPGSCGHFRLGGAGQNLGNQALSWVDEVVGWCQCAGWTGRRLEAGA